jgi:hypothetical protein
MTEQISVFWRIIQPTQWRSVLVEELIILRLVKHFHALCGNWSFITVFTKTNHLSASWARLIQSTSSRPVSWRTISYLLPVTAYSVCMQLPSVSGGRLLHLSYQLLSSIVANLPGFLQPTLWTVCCWGLFDRKLLRSSSLSTKFLWK